MTFYKNIASGKENVYSDNTKRNTKQRGGGLSQNSNEFMIDIDKKNREGEKSLPIQKINIDLVSPAQQVVEHARSELKREHSLQTRQLSKRPRPTHTKKGAAKSKGKKKNPSKKKINNKKY